MQNHQSTCRARLSIGIQHFSCSSPSPSPLLEAMRRAARYQQIFTHDQKPYWSMLHECTEDTSPFLVGERAAWELNRVDYLFSLTGPPRPRRSIYGCTDHQRANHCMTQKFEKTMPCSVFSLSKAHLSNCGGYHNLDANIQASPEQVQSALNSKKIQRQQKAYIRICGLQGSTVVLLKMPWKASQMFTKCENKDGKRTFQSSRLAATREARRGSMIGSFRSRWTDGEEKAVNGPPGIYFYFSSSSG